MNPPQPQIEVLLATFNGARFLPAQIDSILAQDYPAVTILARDDGSTDTTPDILAHYVALHPTRIRVLPQSLPTGSAKLNFRLLMQSAEAPYLAFADQDDLWLPTKLSQSMTAMQRLEQQHGPEPPLLVFTNLTIVDEALNPLHPSMWQHLSIDPTAALRLPRLLGRSVVTGCTMLINRPMLTLARQMPPKATMHDRWIALLAASLGAAAYLPESTLLYRQHDQNVIGAALADSSLTGLATRTADNRGRLAERRRSEHQAEALLNLHRDLLSPYATRLLELYLQSGRNPSPLTRVVLTLRHGFTRGGLLPNLALLRDLLRTP